MDRTGEALMCIQLFRKRLPSCSAFRVGRVGNYVVRNSCFSSCQKQKSVQAVNLPPWSLARVNLQTSDACEIAATLSAWESKTVGASPSRIECHGRNTALECVYSGLFWSPVKTTRSMSRALNFPYVKTWTIAQANFYRAFWDPEQSNSLSYGCVFSF